eukprot:scaffold3320_cov136-Skeletonema_menzelii.AAC.3
MKGRCRSGSQPSKKSATVYGGIAVAFVLYKFTVMTPLIWQDLLLGSTPPTSYANLANCWYWSRLWLPPTKGNAFQAENIL